MKIREWDILFLGIGLTIPGWIMMSSVLSLGISTAGVIGTLFGIIILMLSFYCMIVGKNGFPGLDYSVLDR